MTMTGSEHGEYLATFEEIKSVLILAQSHRHERQDMDGDTLGWIRYEREQATEAVTRLRARLGKGPVAMSLVERAESRAAGHVDYTRKFALGCADLVHDHFIAGS